MKLKNYLILTTIATTSVIVILLSLGIFYLVNSSYETGLQQRGLELARVMAHDPHVVRAVERAQSRTPTLHDPIQSYIEAIRQRTDASYIVIVNRNAIRLTHPNLEQIGKHFIGQDIHRVLTQGDEYSTEASGSLGKAIRNFSPIVDADDHLIGAVCVGFLSDNAAVVMANQRLHMGMLIALIYLLTISAMMAFLWKLKRTFLDYEPEFIVNKFREHEMIFDSLRDAIIVVDKNMCITTINRTAIHLLSMGVLNRYDYMHHPLSNYSAQLSHLALNQPTQLSQDTFQIGKLTYRANCYPINTNKGWMGQVIVFFPALSTNELEAEVSYLKRYAELLRSKTHEHANKLNVLSGMLQMGNYQESIDYIQQESDQYQSMIHRIVSTISDSAVAGLLLAKFTQASNMKVHFVLDDDSILTNETTTQPEPISEKLVTILGNLIDNALLAAWQNRDNVTPEVSVYMSDRGQHIVIDVEDNGAGIPDKIANHILDFGITSKEDSPQHGVGLYLVKQLVDYFQGSIDWEKTERDTTLFSIYLDKASRCP